MKLEKLVNKNKELIKQIEELADRKFEGRNRLEELSNLLCETVEKLERGEVPESEIQRALDINELANAIIKNSKIICKLADKLEAVK